MIDSLYVGDCLEILKTLPDKSVDLTFCSPPYEDLRTYGVEFKLKGDDWVDWAFERYMECVRVTKGLVAWVVEGKTKNFQWSATPILLMNNLHRAGVKLRKPPVYKRVGIPGSGGPEWLRNDYEFIICSSHGRLPWADNVACGNPPVYSLGGKMSHRLKDGKRVNSSPDEEGVSKQGYNEPELANPGNVISLSAGGGHLGSKLAHENEAPFPLKLADFFVKSFCPPDGIVLDPFMGSGTTLCSATLNGRNFIGIDLRESQKELAIKRLNEIGFHGIR
jgi:site-specific DNA-methyltransferase (adenine-specific)